MAESETMSVDASTENQEDPLQDLSDEKLYQLLEETLAGNDVLHAETHMFDKYLKRSEPKDLAVTYQVVNTANSSTPSQSTHDLSSSTAPVTRHGRKRSKSRSSTIDVLRLTAEQKCEIAQREIEEYRDEIDRLKDESDKKLDNFKAIVEEAEIRMLEVKKAGFEFERDLVKGSVNPRSGKVVAEKVIRYFEDKMRSKDTVIEKLRLKNSTLKVQKNKLTLQLKQKEEMGEVLHEVDFNQLKIENQQYMEKIDERNQDLLRLKLMAGNTLQILNAFKKKLQTLTAESDRLKNEIAQRKELVGRIDAETKHVEEERQKAEAINKKLRQQLGDFRVPDVMEYVGEKADLYELQKKVRSWERKVEIADMALKTHRKTWQQLRLGGPNPTPWQGLPV